jgi:hypothetical protein
MTKTQEKPVQKPVQKEKHETWFETLSENEQGFYKNLHEFITTNDMIRGFLDRFLDECANITKVMEELPLNERKELAERLKVHDEKAINAAVIEDVAKEDMEFHFELAKAANAKSVEKWDKLRKKKTGSQYEIWKSIGRGKSSHRVALDSAHAKIHSVIGTNDPEDGKEQALLAVYKHFVTLLFHYSKGFNQRTIENREDVQSAKTTKPPQIAGQ